jgi:Uma2 family endonuclease
MLAEGSMSTATMTRPMTAVEFAEWVNLPENVNKWFELVRGEVIELPPPMKVHGRVCINVAFALETYSRQRRKGYVTGNDSGVILEREPDTVRGPDVAVYEDAEKFDDLHPKYGEVLPVLAVEVLSPNDRWSRLTRKITDYLKNGVGLVWLIDPQNRDVTVYRPGQEPYALERNQEITGEDVLPGFRCLVAEFFRLPGEPAPSQPPAGG